MWYFGESKYIKVTVDESTVASGLITIYNSAETEVISDAVITVSGSLLSYLWQPGATGIYVAVFSYVSGNERFEERKVVEVWETL